MSEWAEERDAEGAAPDARRALARRRAELTARVDSLRGELDAVQRLRSENSDDDEHDPEGATTSQLWSQSAGLLESALRELDDLDTALRRLDAGEYGVCQRCGRAIDPARLEARPDAALCIDCARLAPR
ncbi:MAG TPA: TraR/DksA C4-type zinc finger protein [Microcella sp.]|nr:TraR/DksA C4-type zinc finger protein [Microcella sp.]